MKPRFSLLALLTLGVILSLSTGCDSGRAAATDPFPMYKGRFTPAGTSTLNIYTDYRATFNNVDIDNFSAASVSGQTPGGDWTYTIPKTGTYAVSVRLMFSGNWALSKSIEVFAEVDASAGSRKRVAIDTSPANAGYDRYVDGMTLLQFTQGQVLRFVFTSEDGSYVYMDGQAVIHFLQ